MPEQHMTDARWAELVREDARATYDASRARLGELQAQISWELRVQQEALAVMNGTPAPDDRYNPGRPGERSRITCDGGSGDRICAAQVFVTRDQDAAALLVEWGWGSDRAGRRLCPWHVEERARRSERQRDRRRSRSAVGGEPEATSKDQQKPDAE